MKKLGFKAALFFTFVSLLFTSCEFLQNFGKELLRALDSPVSSVYLYPQSNNSYDDGFDNYYSDTIQLIAQNEGIVCYEIEFAINAPKTVKFILESTDESVAKPTESSLTLNSSSTTVSGSFSIQAVGEGTCEIKMYPDGFEDVSLSCDVIYVKVTPERTVHIIDKDGNPISNVQIYKGADKYLFSKNDYDNNPVRWTSEDSSFVSVSNGHIFAKAAGKDVKITLKSYDNSVWDYCTVHVLDASNWSVSVNASAMPTKILPGDTFTLSCNVSVDEGIKETVNWKSSNNAVAKVDSNGKVTAVGVGTAEITVVLAENSAVKSSPVLINVSAPPVTCNQFFWGKWQRMDNGEIYEIQETRVVNGSKEYSITSSTDTTLVIEGLGTFTKDTDRIINCPDSTKNNIVIPYYRQGGTDLKYKVRVVGFADSISSSSISSLSRAAATGKKNYKVTAKSEKYSSYEDEQRTDNDGWVELSAPVQGDSQTLTVKNEDTNEIVVVSGLKIETDGANMGTIPLVGKDDYALKVTGTIDEKKKTNGYLYTNKTYPLTLTITNISDIESATSSCRIYTKEGDNLNIKLVNSRYELDDVGISSMMPGATKTINLEVSCNSSVNGCVDTEILIEVTNMNTMRTWVDYVPLRFFTGNIPITIAAESTEGNDETLHGFLIYPDGNSTFFNIKSNSTNTDYHETIYIPNFGNVRETPYRMVFCGANATANLKESGEMFYTVNFNSTTAKVPELSMKKYYSYGEQNNDENHSYQVSESFEAYLNKGDIDFYTIKDAASITSFENQTNDE